MKNQIAPTSGTKTKIGAAEGIRTTFVREVRTVYRGAHRATSKMTGGKGAATFIRKLLPDNSREHFVALYLDGSRQVIGFSIVATGTATACLAHPREVFQRAILVGAVAIIVGHNHPSSDLTPSADDKEVTERLQEAGCILDIRMLDHIIVNEKSFYSFCEAEAL